MTLSQVRSAAQPERATRAHSHARSQEQQVLVKQGWQAAREPGRAAPSCICNILFLKSSNKKQMGHNVETC